MCVCLGGGGLGREWDIVLLSKFILCKISHPPCVSSNTEWRRDQSILTAFVYRTSLVFKVSYPLEGREWSEFVCLLGFSAIFLRYLLLCLDWNPSHKTQAACNKFYRSVCIHVGAMEWEGNCAKSLFNNYLCLKKVKIWLVLFEKKFSLQMKGTTSEW